MTRPLSIIILAATLCAARPAAAEERSSVPLQYSLQHRLPLGVKIEAAPGLLVTKGGKRGAQVVGVTGFLKVHSYADLLIFKGEAETFETEAGPQTTRWFVGVHLGGELQPAKLAGHLFGAARSIVRL